MNSLGWCYKVVGKGYIDVQSFRKNNRHFSQRHRIYGGHRHKISVPIKGYLAIDVNHHTYYRALGGNNNPVIKLSHHGKHFKTHDLGFYTRAVTNPSKNFSPC